ncbi:sarcosine oxidase subunit gamma [Actinoplanes sp. URMC 104]|uniref:sarcosine oxidase subunit gamma n=1 Tax=Actinoplanes sp. URMC 104 TaxID=3423409 RepID=UPI003F1D41D0
MTAEALARTSPLQQFIESASHRPGDARGPLLLGFPASAQVVPEPFIAMADLRVDPAGAAAADVGSHLGIDLPTTPSTWVESGDRRAIWLGPDEWLVTDRSRTPQELEAGLREAVRGRGAVVDVSAQRTTLRLAGANARDVLAAGCSIDLHPAVFRRGAAAQTLLGLTGVVLIALDDTGNNYQILVRSSFATYLARWLLDAAVEYRDS